MTDYLSRPDGLKLAYRFSDGDGPMLVFLPGYMSDMDGGKATALFDWARESGRAALLLDYSGCGRSEGAFAEGTLSKWREDVLMLVDHVGKDRPLLLVGSSMGGWLMLLVALARPRQVKALVGIAAAPDFTDWGFHDAQKAEIREKGVVHEDNPYGPDPTPTYRGFVEDGNAQLLLGSVIPLDCPVRLIHGQKDADVPWRLGLTLAEKLRSNDVQLTFVKEGDHRLSRDEDISLIVGTVAALYDGPATA